MGIEQEKFDRGDSEKQYIERFDEKLGLLELLISAYKDAISAVQKFHRLPCIRLAENDFGIDPYSLLYWWSLKKTEPQKYRRQVTDLRLDGRYNVDDLETAVADYDRRRRAKRCRDLGLNVVDGYHH